MTTSKDNEMLDHSRYGETADKIVLYTKKENKNSTSTFNQNQSDLDATLKSGNNLSCAITQRFGHLSKKLEIHGKAISKKFAELYGPEIEAPLRKKKSRV